ncbi:MAG TPA: glutamine amidotransferase [Tepidisphaeraceae bacterium]
MNRLLEILLGLHHGFLARNGEMSLAFHPHWPAQQFIGAWPWNLLLLLAIAFLLWWVYRREGADNRIKIILACIRATALLAVLALLNRPTLVMEQARVEPSVLPVLIDTSMSMKVQDVNQASRDISRLSAAQNLFSGDSNLLHNLSSEHQIRFYHFDADAQPIPGAQISQLAPTGNITQITQSIHSVLDDLRGQRVAGLILLTDGRQIPSTQLENDLPAIKDFGVRIFPVPLGTQAPAKNIRIENLVVQDTAFLGDLIDARATVRASGFGPSTAVKLVLRNIRTHQVLPLADGSDAITAQLPNDQSTLVELPYKPSTVGPLDLQVEAIPLPGEIDDSDNVRSAQVFVLDTKITVLYVDGYPRWDYRYIKNEMIRDKTVDISCLLTSADPDFIQEGDIPIRRFPETMDELMNYDVVLLGDVDPRQFSDAQLQLINDFVAKQGGGLGMVAGPRFSPQAYRGTPIEPILPVNISQVSTDESDDPIVDSFRPIITPPGLASGIFRFLPNAQANQDYLKNDWPPLYWFCRGITPKPGVGEVYAQHPTSQGPDGKPAPIMVFGRYGAGRTMFSAIDDSWRWRFYTGENVFDTYWVQTLRQLSRGRKIGQRRFAFTSAEPFYDLGSRVQLNLRLLDPRLTLQLPEQIPLSIRDANQQLISQPILQRNPNQHDLYTASFPADRVGHFIAELFPLQPDLPPADLAIDIQTPRLELADPQVDLSSLNRLAAETYGQVVPFNQTNQLPQLIPSVAKSIPVTAEEMIWNSPLAMVLIAGLIIAEWILRKAWGLV